MIELVGEGLLTQQEVVQMWEGLPKAANSVNAAGVPGTEKGTLINLQGFLEFDRQVFIAQSVFILVRGRLGPTSSQLVWFACFIEGPFWELLSVVVRDFLFSCVLLPHGCFSHAQNIL